MLTFELLSPETVYYSRKFRSTLGILPTLLRAVEASELCVSTDSRFQANLLSTLLTQKQLSSNRSCQKLHEYSLSAGSEIAERQKSMAEQVPDDRTRLKDHFAGGGAGNGSQWAKLWETKFTPWDRGLPNPALENLLRDRKDLLGSCWKDKEKGGKQRKKALVPGCGKGYDGKMTLSRHDAVLELLNSADSLCGPACGKPWVRRIWARSKRSSH